MELKCKKIMADDSNELELLINKFYKTIVDKDWEFVSLALVLVERKYSTTHYAYITYKTK